MTTVSCFHPSQVIMPEVLSSGSMEGATSCHVPSWFHCLQFGFLTSNERKLDLLQVSKGYRNVL